MKLLVICSHYPPLESPEGTHAMMLCEQMARTGLQTHLLTSNLPLSAPVPNGFELHPAMPGWTWSSLPTLIRECRRISPDVILLMYIGWIYGDNPMITFTPTFLHRALPHVRVVTQFENTLGAKVGSWLSGIAWKVAATLARGPGLEPTYGSLLSDSDGVIALSNHHLEILLASYPAAKSKSRVISAPPLLRVSPDERGDVRREARLAFGLRLSEEGTIVFGYFGYIYPSKGVDTLLRAFRIVRDRLEAAHGPHVRLVLIGKMHPALSDDLFLLAQNLGIPGDLVWTGYCTDQLRASTYLRGLDAAVLPFDQGAHLNNSSFVVCAAHGLPIVTTRAAQVEAGFESGRNVVLCVPKDPGALADAMELVATDASLRQDLRSGAQALADDEFSWARHTARMVEALGSARRER